MSDPSLKLMLTDCLYYKLYFLTPSNSSCQLWKPQIQEDHKQQSHNSLFLTSSPFAPHFSLLAVNKDKHRWSI